MSRSTRTSRPQGPCAAITPDPAAAAVRSGARSSLLRLAPRRPAGAAARVLFTSRLISEMSGNLQVVHARMVERGLDRDVDLDGDAQARPDRALERSSTGCRLARALAGADVIVLDDSFPPLNWVKLSPAVRIIQLWHASGAFKTVGYSRAGLPATRTVRGPQERTPRAIVSSEFDVPFYAEAFGIPEERVIPTGIPRMDRFFDDDGAGERAGGGRARPSRRSSGRMTILFAPTYRGDTIREASYALRAARLRGAPRAGGRARRGGHHQDAPVRARAGARSRSRSATA